MTTASAREDPLTAPSASPAARQSDPGMSSTITAARISSRTSLRPPPLDIYNRWDDRQKPAADDRAKRLRGSRLPPLERDQHAGVEREGHAARPRDFFRGPLLHSASICSTSASVCGGMPGRDVSSDRGVRTQLRRNPSSVSEVRWPGVPRKPTHEVGRCRRRRGIPGHRTVAGARRRVGREPGRGRASSASAPARAAVLQSARAPHPRRSRPRRVARRSAAARAAPCGCRASAARSALAPAGRA